MDDLEIAKDALAKFRHGWESGEWKPFVDLLAPGFTQRVPIGELRGREVGYDETKRHFRALRLMGLRLALGEPTRTTSGAGTVVFEVPVSGQLYGKPYQNRLVLSFDVADGKLTAMREYFGDLDPEILREGLK